MTEHNFEHMRRAMVASQLRTTGVNDPAVLAAMGAVPREEFVPAERVPVAYSDMLIPVGAGRHLNTPMALGRELTEARPNEGDRALVIGAATGYAAAVLARLVGSVVAVEEDPVLFANAEEALAGAGVTLVHGPLNEGYSPGAPYDLILIDGAVEFIPDAVIDQLAQDGRLVAAILDNGVSRIALGRRGGDGFGIAAVSDVAAPVLPGFTKPRSFSF